MRHRLALCLLIALATSITPWSFGDALNFGSGSALGEPRAAVDFLPIEEAYQLFPHQRGETLALEWLAAPGYYLYQERFKAELVTAKGLKTTLPLNFEPGVTRYDDYYEKDVEVYYQRTTVTGKLAQPLVAGDVLVVESQACADAGLCYPPRTQYVRLTDGKLALSDLPPATVATTAPQSPLMVILFFALLGGVLLNLMPCVFPVLSIKVLSLTHSQLSPHSRHSHGLAYTLGVVAAFVVFALLLIALRAGGEALGWGFQLQSPAFIVALVYLFFLMALSFSGVVHFGTRLMNFGQGAASGSGLHHSFLTGVLATVVASPCSAPFMGTALGFALTQSTPVALLVFTALGLGMALPFLLLTWLPGLLNRLPKPGAWMDTLKEFLAFPLYLTCIWLLWILGRQTSSDTLSAVLTGLVVLAFALWLGEKRQPLARIIAILATALALLLPAWQLRDNPSDPVWEPYSAKRLQALLAEEKPVFINATADWCITCLANEKIALNSDDFHAALKTQGIVYLKADWTDRDPEITALLATHGRSGVPLYLFYRAGEQTPVLLPQLLSKTLIIDTFNGN